MGVFFEGLMFKQQQKKGIMTLVDLQTGRWVNQLGHSIC